MIIIMNILMKLPVGSDTPPTIFEGSGLAMQTELDQYQSSQDGVSEFGMLKDGCVPMGLQLLECESGPSRRLGPD